MQAGAGKIKGGAFERHAAKRLSLWLSHGKRDDLLWRSAMSGGRATLQYNKEQINQAQSGDLTAIAQDAYEFCRSNYIECKFYQDLQIDSSFLRGAGNLFKFWQATVEEAGKYGKFPLLIARQNRYPTLAIAWGGVFPSPPLMILNHWAAMVYLFEDVTKVRRKFSRAGRFTRG